jgi:outer membrane protein OmpA-like peptidoglycan-associated protein
MKYLNTSLMVVTTALFLSACATKTVELNSAEVMAKYQSVQELNRLLIGAKKSGTDYLAPQGYEEAREIYLKAFENATEQKPGANELAQKGIKEIKLAMNNAKGSETILRDVLDARNKALIVSALTLFPKDFSRVESRLRVATVSIEENKIEQAKKMRAGLIKDYAKLELASLEKSITVQAKATIDQAKGKDADDHAPKTFKLAEEELALTIDILNAGRTQVGKAKEHADLSVYYANKSMQITDLVKDFKKQDFTEEDKMLWYQQQLETINQPFKQPLAFDQANSAVVSGVQNQITMNLQKLMEREQDLYSANENIALLEERLRSMDLKYEQTVAGLNKKMQGNDASMRKELNKLKQDNLRAEARYKKIQNMFSEEEATVFRQGNNVLLETHAFNFKIGGSEIDSKNYDLLEKILEAIKVFDNPDIVIMGHTDATGSDGLNLQLSQKRAETVTAFLQKIAKFPPQKVSTKGYGEARPVATNETREGRERNRRIEVLIINK